MSPPGRRDRRGAELEDELDELDEFVEPSTPTEQSALHEDEVLRLIGTLRREIDRCQGHRPPRSAELPLETLAELLVLLTALPQAGGGRLPAPSRIDEHIEDMIDPEFGLRPARKIITEAAELILRGHPALERPRGRSRRGRLLDSDED